MNLNPFSLHSFSRKINTFAQSDPFTYVVKEDLRRYLLPWRFKTWTMGLEMSKKISTINLLNEFQNPKAFGTKHSLTQRDIYK